MGAEQKTFIILIPGFPADESDSTCVPFPQAFVKNFKRLNPSMEIVVLALQYPFSSGVYSWHGVRVHAFNGRNKGNVRRLLLWVKVALRLRRIMKNNDVTGVLSFWFGECAVIARFAAAAYGVKAYTWLMGQDARAHNRYIRFLKPDGSKMIAISDFIASQLFRNYKLKPAHVIPPGIDCRLAIKNPDARDIDILGAGSLIALKRYDVFIAAVEKLAMLRPSIKTIICGDGPEREKLNMMIVAKGLSSNIILCGEQSHDNVIALMQRSRIFLHPSDYEGFATVLAEALYASSKVVCFCKPMNTVFKNQYVIESEDQMLATLEKLLDNNIEEPESVVTYPIELTCNRILSLYA